MPPRVNGKKKVEAKPNVVVDGDANDSNEVDSGTPILLEANGAQRKRVRRPRAPRADQRGRALLRAHPLKARCGAQLRGPAP